MRRNKLMIEHVLYERIQEKENILNHSLINPIYSLMWQKFKIKFRLFYYDNKTWKKIFKTFFLPLY